MTEVEFNTSVALLRDLDKQIQTAQVEVKVREDRLAELRPKREALEQQAQEEFECPVKELPAKIGEAEDKFIAGVARLKSDVERVTAAASATAAG
jgi:predicted  nucleic acid-binding Zn-ribbon protein